MKNAKIQKMTQNFDLLTFGKDQNFVKSKFSKNRNLGQE